MKSVKNGVKKAAEAGNERNASFELLRIFAMLLIIGHHYMWYGGSSHLTNSDGVNFVAANFLFLGGALGVNIFFCITGYFAEKTSFRLERFCRIELAMIFYLLIGAVISAAVFKAKLTIYQWVSAVLPISLNNYWFITVYSFIFFLSPFFKLMLKHIDEKQLGVMVLVMTVFLAVIPALNFAKNINIFQNILIRSVYAYFVGAYFAKRKTGTLRDKYLAASAAILSYAAFGILTIMSKRYAETVPVWGVLKETLLRHEAIIPMLCSVSIMMFFADLKLGNIKWIRFISQTVFGVYIIHENPFFKGYMWDNILKVQRYTHADHYLLRAFGIMLLIFVSCSAIDLIRIYLLEKPLFKIGISGRRFNKIDTFMNMIGGKR